MIKTTLPNMQEKVHHRVTAGRKLAVTITHPPRFCNDLDICYRLETYNWLYFPWEKVLLFLPKIWIYNFIFLWKGTLQIISNLYSENPPFDPGRESCLPRVRKGWGAIFLGTVEPIRCALISFLGNLSEDKDKSLYITTMTLSSTTVLIITWELNVVFFFFKIFFYFSILLKEFISWLSILKQKESSAKYQKESSAKYHRFPQIENSPPASWQY